MEQQQKPPPPPPHHDDEGCCDDDGNDDTVDVVLEEETTFCQSPEERGVLFGCNNADCTDQSTKHHPQQPIPQSSSQSLPFGYFSCGNKLYRNKLNSQELLEDGYVTLSNLSLPFTECALLTTFDSSRSSIMKPSIKLLKQRMPQIPKLLLIGHGDYCNTSFCGIRVEDNDVDSEAQQQQPDNNNKPTRRTPRKGMVLDELSTVR